MQRRDLLSAAILAGVPTIGRAQAKIVKLTYATYLPPEALAATVDTWFMQQVTQRSGKRITFETYPAGSLLEAVDVFPRLENGAADLVTGTPGAYNTRDYPLTSVTLPYITDRADVATRAFGDLLKDGPLRTSISATTQCRAGRFRSLRARYGATSESASPPISGELAYGR